jgi:hypothetical protein
MVITWMPRTSTVGISTAAAFMTGGLEQESSPLFAGSERSFGFYLS